jgi:hypothetical protein
MHMPGAGKKARSGNPIVIIKNRIDMVGPAYVLRIPLDFPCNRLDILTLRERLRARKAFVSYRVAMMKVEPPLN